MSEPVDVPDALSAPGLWRRLACLLYEGVLLFGVVVVAGLLYGVATQQRHALSGLLGLQIVVFVVFGVYFVWFWSCTGQTLAMQTWRIRLVTKDGGPVSRVRALGRYLLVWLVLLAILAGLHLARLALPANVAGAIAGVLIYAGLSWLRPDRQYWHDAACGTRLVVWPAPARRTSS